MRALGFTTALMILVASPARGQSDAAFDDTRLEKRVLHRGFERPLELAVTPDGRVLVIELEGKLWIYQPETAELELALELEVFTEQENGLLGLTLDPHFAENGWVYLQYSPLDFVGQHVSRFRMVGDRLDPDSEQVLFSYEEQRRECCHHAGSMAFGPDGCLFIACGDNTHPHGDSGGFAPLDERPGRSPWDARRTSANTDSYSGKVLRIRPLPGGGYEVPQGNLFAADGSQGRPEIYAMGCRNPWRISVDARTGFLYWGDVGPDAGSDGPPGPRGYDEVNQARGPGNFGWPLFIGANRAYVARDFETGVLGARFDPERPLNDSRHNTGARVLPPAEPAWISYASSGSEEYPILHAGGGRTACAGPVYHFDPTLDSPTRFPAWFDGALLIYEWSRHWVMVVHMDEAGEVVEISPLAGGLSFTRPVDMCFGPEGSLYVLEYGSTWGPNEDSALVRIDYVSGNRVPRAVASSGLAVGAAPLTVEFSSTGSHDPDGDPLRCEWRVHPEESAFAVGPAASYTFQEPGVHTVELRVQDSQGASGIARLPVRVGNTPPVVSFDAPRDGGFFDWSRAVDYRVQVSDAEDGRSEGAEGEDLVWWMENVFVEAAFHQGPLPGQGGAPVDPDDPGLELMKPEDCFNCHAVERRVVGPAFLEVAERYRGDEAAFEAALARVREGSSGVWGDTPMRPHEGARPEELRAMVRWVFELEPGQDQSLIRPGLAGDLLPPNPEPGARPAGLLELEATYTDLGGGPVEPLRGGARVYLRTARVEAEHGSFIRGLEVRQAQHVSEGACLAGSASGAAFVVPRVDLAGIRRVRARLGVSSGLAALELRVGSAEGRLLAAYEVSGESAVFTLPTSPASVWIRVPSGRYVCADTAASNQVLANRDALGPWETFTLIPAADGTYTLRSYQGHALYVDTEARLMADSASVPGEPFTIRGSGSGGWSLETSRGQAVLVAEQAGGRLQVATETGAGTPLQLGHAKRVPLGWSEQERSIEPPPGLHDLHVVLRTSLGSDGTVAVDWLEFLP